MANKTNWEVSYIDEDGVYHGGVNGVVTGLAPVYTTAVTAIDLSVRFVVIEQPSVPLSLADGSDGQVITIKATAALPGSVITPANFADGTTATLDTQFDYVVLQFGNGEWHVVGGNATIV